MLTIKISEKLNNEQTETISNIIHEVLLDLGYGEHLDYYAWDLDVNLDIDVDRETCSHKEIREEAEALNKETM